MKKIIFLLLYTTALSHCSCSQAQQGNAEGALNEAAGIGGRCEDCAAIYESPVPFSSLTSMDTLPDYHEAGPKLEVSGIIYQADGRTPAKDVVLYVYHTDQQGIYAKKANEKGWGKKHGYIRGWVKTGQDGRYQFYTLVPASYPNSNNPKHIHPVIKESDKAAYWIDEFLFDDDPLLPAGERNKLHPRGGSGIVKTRLEGGVLRARRDIILGLNVPGYPAGKKG